MTRSHNDIGRRNGGFSLLRKLKYISVIIRNGDLITFCTCPTLVTLFACHFNECLERLQAAIFTLLHQIYPPRGYKDAFQLPLTTGEAEARSPRGFAKPDIHCR